MQPDPRFYDVTSGEILVDGQDVRKVTLKSLREAIGVVQQDVYLFSGTVAENIAYGKPGASQEEIIAAAKLAGADGFVRALKDGYDTYVGERGVKLSGGQKQRISIARVFLKNPPILLLDEATSALDNESEILVGQSLDALAKGRTTLTIAHRLTTIKNADRILVLGKEGIEGRRHPRRAAGSKRHLLSTCGTAGQRPNAVTYHSRSHRFFAQSGGSFFVRFAETFRIVSFSLVFLRQGVYDEEQRNMSAAASRLKGGCLMKRSSGILMHLSSLASPYGIGTMGKAARNFVDFLYRAGQGIGKSCQSAPPAMATALTSLFPPLRQSVFYRS